jgi:hypothetical protein
VQCLWFFSEPGWQAEKMMRRRISVEGRFMFVRVFNVAKLVDCE